MATIFFSVWSLGNPQKLLTTNQFLVSTILFTIMNISLFSLRFDLFSIITKEVNQIKNNVVCVRARLVFVFCCAFTTGRCNAFQYIFVKLKEMGVLLPIFLEHVTSCGYDLTEAASYFSKTSILTNKGPLVVVFLRRLHITCKTYHNLSVKAENYQLNQSTSLM